MEMAITTFLDPKSWRSHCPSAGDSLIQYVPGELSKAFSATRLPKCELASAARAPEVWASTTSSGTIRLIMAAGRRRVWAPGVTPVLALFAAG
jgi:hypothetical protein